MNRIFIQHISFVCILLVSLIIFPTKLCADPKSILNQENEYGISIQSYNSKLYYFIQTKQDVLKLQLATNGKEAFHIFKNGRAALDGFEPDAKGSLLFLKYQKKYELFHISSRTEGNYRIQHIPLWLSIVPPILAILLALIFKEVILALFIGLFSGVFIAGGLRFDSFFYFIVQFFNTITDYLVPTLTDTSHMAVIVFSLLIGGMVGIISKNGGMAGVVSGLSRYATTAVSTQVITWFMGIAIFFDDYANTLIVGNTMKNISDKFRISREKLAYIVDSTAAPVAAIAFITTWIGAELGYIGDGIKTLEGIDPNLTPYTLFLQSLKYAYYPVFTLVFVLLIILLKREYGPMYQAEMKARSKSGQEIANDKPNKEIEEEQFFPSEKTPARWGNAVVPVVLLILTTILGLIVTGLEKSASLIAENGQQLVHRNWGAIWEAVPSITGSDALMVNLGFVIGNADSFTSLLWGSLTGLAVAVILSLSQKLLNVGETFTTMTFGFKSMIPALMILALAWSLAKTTQELHTAEFITSALAGLLKPQFMPALVFLLSGLISFSTGSSWSTMAILFPIAMPASWTLSQEAGLDPAESTQILVIVISSIMGASVLGDHSSPISDTTILSSLSSGCNHVQHVRTQLPYALTVGIIAFLFTLLSAFHKGNNYYHLLYLITGVLLMYFVIYRFGKKINE